MTPVFSPGAVVANIGSTRLNWGLLLCFLFGLLVWIFFRFSRLGFELAASGENVRCARYARLLALVDELRAAALATAHHRDDVAEGVLV